MAVVENDDGKIIDINNSKTNTDENNFDDLVGTVIEQNVLEHQVENKAQRNIDLQRLKTERRRLNRTKDALATLRSAKRDLERKAYKSSTKVSDKEKYIKRINLIEGEEIEPLLKDLRQISDRIKLIKNEISNENVVDEMIIKNEGLDDNPLPEESEHDYLLRVGKITAFGSKNEFEMEDEEKEVKIKEEGSYTRDNDEYQPSNKELYNDVTSEEGEEINRDYVSDEETELHIKTQKFTDDGDEYSYQKRLRLWINGRVKERESKKVLAKYPTSAEWLNTKESFKSAALSGGFKIPGEVFEKLFNYQKTCVQWLWELHQQGVGGILGDEMGLGKTIQVIAFLAGLHHSNKIKKPILIVCPATVLKQWFVELTKWWPCFRCVIFHSMGAIFDKQLENLDEETMDRFLMMNDDLDYDNYINENVDVNAGGNALEKKKKRNLQSVAKITNHLKNTLEKINKDGHVIITTYAGLQANSKLLLSQKFDYVVLDEGHKIRNPNTSIAVTCKKLKCENRLILSGTPIQNNLNELWSLFDFIYPGKLGTLPMFQDQFAQPINEGGYSNATNLQVQTGYRCAVELKNIISPFLLRRVKADVAKDLPEKKELVLFCKLTKPQRAKYIQFLNSEELVKIKRGRFQALFGIDHLRKICNHPDLVADLGKEPKDFGNPIRSGKMQVIKQLLTDFKKNGHKTLLFTQSRQMLKILEQFIKKDLEFKYLKMDGTTSIKSRQSIVDKFNGDNSIDIFLLTTRVGGLGINLVSATRIIIFDPDWNPSTDLQARERAWRIGQTREVIIYRLLIGGSIEEKIYHRQIFKQFLTNKILKDPNQKRFFKMDELQDLFSLGDEESSSLSYENTQTINKLTDRETKGINDNIEEVKGLHKLEGYYNEKDETERSTTEDDRIIGGLLGVSGSIDHENLIASDDNIGKEASRKAKEAAKTLQENFRKNGSKTQARMGKVTWTGKYGKSGKTVNAIAPKKRPLSVSNSVEEKSIKRKK